MTISELCIEAHATAVEKGWYDPSKTTVEALMLMVSELAEACEELRQGRDPTWVDRVGDWQTGKPVGFATELADCVIRIADTCAHLGIDLEKVLRMKMDYNKTRARRHGKAL